MPSNPPSAREGVEVLLTGGTGFIGKIMLEELLRRSAEFGISRVFLLVRPRGSESPQSRFSKIVAAPCMAGLPAGAMDKVTVVPADSPRLRCGMSDDSSRMLAGRVTHVIHCAGSVRFDQSLATAAEANITVALELLEFAKRCRRLDKMVSVSTAYVTPHREGPLEEELVPLPFDAEQLYADILAGRDARKAFAATGHPNTYTFTKCMAEHLLLNRREHVSIVLVRPSIVSATWRQPFPGWIDSTAALSSYLLMIGSGRLRSVIADPAARLDVVPCDVVVDRILRAAFSTMESGESRIEHAVVGVEKGIRIWTIRERALRFFRERPYDAWPALHYVGRNRLAYELCSWSGHVLPLQAAMALARLRGNKAAVRRARRQQQGLSSLNMSFRYFTSHTFDFRSRCAFAASDFDSTDYLETVCRGLYRHVLRLDDVNVPIGGKKAKGTHGALWALQQVHGTPAHLVLAPLFAAGVHRCADRVSFNLAAFRAAKAWFPANATIVIVPQGTSVADAWFCSYLCLARADLGLAFPANLGFGWVAKSQRAANPTLLLSPSSSASTWSQLQRLRDQPGVGHPVVLLPVSISYERRVEDDSQYGEISQGGRIAAAARILRRIVRGNLDLGRVDLSCGSPLAVDGITEMTIDDHLAAQWRASRAALTGEGDGSRPPGREVDPVWSRAGTHQRGGVVLEGSLAKASSAPLLDEQPSCAVVAQVASWSVPQRDGDDTC